MSEASLWIYFLVLLFFFPDWPDDMLREWRARRRLRKMPVVRHDKEAGLYDHYEPQPCIPWAAGPSDGPSRRPRMDNYHEGYGP